MPHWLHPLYRRQAWEPTSISFKKLRVAFNNSIGSDKYGSPKLFPHDYKSEYAESVDYGDRDLRRLFLGQPRVEGNTYLSDFVARTTC